MKDDQNRKYPKELFLVGIVFNFIAKFYLCVPGLILLVIGLIARSRPFIVFGAAMLAIDLVLAVSDQFMIKQTFEEPTDNPEFKPYQDAITGGNWREDLEKLTNPERHGDDPPEDDEDDASGEDSDSQQNR